MYIGNLDSELKAKDRKLRALELRLSGETFNSIAEKLGYASVSGAYKAVQTALKKTLQQPADEVRKMEIERLDSLLSVMWPHRHKPEYLDRIIKVMERRAKLLGLDAVIRQDITTNGESLNNDKRTEILRKLDSIATARDAAGTADAPDPE